MERKDGGASGGEVVPALEELAAQALARTLDMWSSLRGLPSDYADTVLRALGRHVKRRNSLLTDEAVDPYIDLLLSSVRDGCALSAFNLQWANKVTGKGLRAAAERLNALTTLDLSYCERIDDEGLTAIATHNPGLRHVSLTYCKRLTDKGVGKLAMYCGRIESLCLELCAQVGDLGAQAIARNLGELTDLNLGGCAKVSNVGVQIIASHGARLSRLNLSGSVLVDYDLEDVASHCNALQHLQLRACSKITDGGARQLARLGKRKATSGFPPLLMLDLGGCARVTDKGIAMVARQNRGLTRLDVRGTRLSGRGLKEVVLTLTSLEELNVAFCKEVPPEALLHAQANLKCLRTLVPTPPAAPSC